MRVGCGGRNAVIARGGQCRYGRWWNDRWIAATNVLTGRGEAAIVMACVGRVVCAVRPRCHSPTSPVSLNRAPKMARVRDIARSRSSS